MKNILFLTDFSESSMHAMHYGCSLFSQKEHNYFILHVSKAGNLSLSKLASSDSIYDTVIGDDKEKLKIIKNTLENQYNTTFKASIRFNNFIDAVQEYVSKYNIDTIVTGFDGANSLREKIFGSNTLKLIRSIRTETIIVPQEAVLSKPKEVLCLLDDKDSLEIILSPSILQDKILKVVRVVNNNDYTTASKDQFILKNHDQVNYQLISNIPLNYVKSYVLQTNPIDLTVLLIEETSVLDRLFIDNSTTKINKSLFKPILILHQ
ncbi:universal stress protein [Tenacibaculum sp. 190524A05c]|uniref:universal stress protein n=1 Tax=Tenacibaculum platacis TaxID=3137852 RepID=UPI0032B22B53